MALNRILDDSAREEYADDVQALHELCADMIHRKIPRANVQQAFVFNAVKKLVPNKDAKILCAGSFMDTASVALQRFGYRNIIDIDPVINYSLHEYLMHEFSDEVSSDEDETVTSSSREIFDAVFSTSVIEHVENDIEYFDDVISVVKPGGFVVITFDYKPDWQPGQPVPISSRRFYTPDSVKAMQQQFKDGGFSVHGGADYDGDIDFTWDGIHYAFGTAVFKKKNAS